MKLAQCMKYSQTELQKLLSGMKSSSKSKTKFAKIMKFLIDRLVLKPEVIAKICNAKAKLDDFTETAKWSMSSVF